MVGNVPGSSVLIKDNESSRIDAFHVVEGCINLEGEKIPIVTGGPQGVSGNERGMVGMPIFVGFLEGLKSSSM